MADVRPFRGVTYDARRVDLRLALCPPYDVISPAQQEAYYEREPHNAVRIVLNRAAGDARYSEAASELRQWLADGALERAGEGAFYVHRHTFKGAGTGEEARVSRVGVVAAVRLEPWSAGAVKPHEHTMPGPKEDRLALMRATLADTEPIWCFLPDPDGEVGQALQAITAAEPTFATTYRPVPGVDGEAPAEIHEVWAVRYPATVDRLRIALSRNPLYIADGHHRYETALHNAREVGGGPDDASRFKMVLISPADDPGLVILPTHRLVRLPSGTSVEQLLAALQVMGWTDEPMAGLADLSARLRVPSPMGRLGIGLFAGGQFRYVEGAVLGGNVSEMARSLQVIDVALLQAGILQPLLGIGEAELADGKVIAYSRDAAEVVARVRDGEFELGIFVRPPTLAQVQAVADAGDNMPQKSTYFWPKPASGLVMMLQPPGEPL
jgi:uncharacterized protein (DUF1015 family)